MSSSSPASGPGDAIGAPEQVRIAALIERHQGRGGELIEVLHEVQDQLGHLPATALRQVARGLELPLSHVVGVASFYHLFHLQPRTAHGCGVCLGTACFVRGASALVDRLQVRLGVQLDAAAVGRGGGERGGGERGGWRLQGVSCQGACGLGPLLLLDGRPVGGLPLASPELLQARFDALGLPAVGEGQP